MKTLNFKKTGIIVAVFAMIVNLACANEKEPINTDAEENMALQEAHDQLLEHEIQKKLMAEVYNPATSIIIVDLDGNIIDEITYEGTINWPEHADLKNKLSRSSFLIEHQNKQFYLFDVKATEALPVS
ncbi:hypothetical protein ACFCT7_14730 [Fulvivirgaceae bacterium LMO-SS25]